MSDGKTTLKNGFEELLNKSIEASKVFINEGSRIVKQLSNKETTINNVGLTNDLLTNAFNEYVKLNVNHFNNLIDLGVNFVKNINNNPASQTKSQAEPVNEPGFILEGSSEQGQPVNFQFLLDNIKQEPVICQLINSDYLLQTDDSSREFKTYFTPQSFELKPGESRSVNISIHIPEDTVPGFYKSKVQVRGFEPAFFSVQFTVIERKMKPTPNARKKRATPKSK